MRIIFVKTEFVEKHFTHWSIFRVVLFLQNLIRGRNYLLADLLAKIVSTENFKRPYSISFALLLNAYTKSFDFMKFNTISEIISIHFWKTRLLCRKKHISRFGKFF